MAKKKLDKSIKEAIVKGLRALGFMICTIFILLVADPGFQTWLNNNFGNAAYFGLVNVLLVIIAKTIKERLPESKVTNIL